MISVPAFGTARIDRAAAAVQWSPGRRPHSPVRERPTRIEPVDQGRRLVGFAALLALGVVALALTIWFQTRRAVRESAEAVEAAERVPFRSIAVAGLGGGFEAVAADPEFSRAAWFAGDLWLAGAGGLARYDSEGALKRLWSVGADLPPAPILHLAAGPSPDGGAPMLYAATGGEGLLVVGSDDSIQQIRAEDAADRDLTAVLPLATGTVLLGTEQRGVLRWSGDRLARFETEPPGQRATTLDITALAGDEGDLWIGTQRNGVLHRQGGRSSAVEGTSDGPVFALAVGGGQAYAATATGVLELEGERLTRRLAEGFLVQALDVTGGVLAAGTLDEGLLEIPLEARRPLRPTADVSGGPATVRQLLRLDDELLALAPDGLYRRTASGAWERVVAPPAAPLRDRNVSALHVDEGGRLWVGYFDRGLDVVAGGERTAEIETDRVFCVNRIKSSGDGVTAVATANGISLMDGAVAVRQHLTKDDGLIATHVTDLASTRAGLTLATPAGLTFLEPTGTSSLYAFHGLVNNHVYALGLEGERLLAGTLGGLSVIDGGAVTESFTTANSPLPHNWITGFASFGGDVFVGTYGGGVVRFDGAGGWKQYPELAGVEINPNAMVAGARTLYAGGLERGLLVYVAEAERWDTLTTGLPSVNVTALEYADGMLYVGTDNGLVKISEEKLLAGGGR